MASNNPNVDALDLSKYAVGPLDTIYYIPDFVSPAELSFLLHQVNAAPASKWKVLKNRRLQNWGGIVESKGLIPQSLPSWLTAVTEKIHEVTGLFPSPINHVLVNEYLPGQGILAHQDGPSYYPVVAILSLGAPTLMQFKPHLRLREANGTRQPDGSTEQQLGSEQTDKDVSRKQDPIETSVALMPGSLLIFKDSAYQDYLHGIDGASEYKLDSNVANLKLLSGDTSEQSALILRQTGARISLTCRYVPKLCRSFIKL